mmetsp:Transcript_68523/g.142848  ORF Transcript_68523/g.142848 Transcript_68523/m.142848 type:complete len:215 (+) Transcript_68523:5057-5701(+)
MPPPLQACVDLGIVDVPGKQPRPLRQFFPLLGNRRLVARGFVGLITAIEICIKFLRPAPVRVVAPTEERAIIVRSLLPVDFVLERPASWIHVPMIEQKCLVLKLIEMPAFLASFSNTGFGAAPARNRLGIVFLALRLLLAKKRCPGLLAIDHSVREWILFTQPAGWIRRTPWHPSHVRTAIRGTVEAGWTSPWSNCRLWAHWVDIWRVFEASAI